MGIIGASGCALLAVTAILLLREWKSALVPGVRLSATLLLVGAAVALLAPILEKTRTLMSCSGAGEYGGVMLRALGIALLSELTATFCRDLGENGVGEGVEMLGKVEILLLCLPLVEKVLELAKELLGY